MRVMTVLLDIYNIDTTVVFSTITFNAAKYLTAPTGPGLVYYSAFILGLTQNKEKAFIQLLVEDGQACYRLEIDGVGDGVGFWNPCFHFLVAWNHRLQRI